MNLQLVTILAAAIILSPVFFGFLAIFKKTRRLAGWLTLGLTGFCLTAVGAYFYLMRPLQFSKPYLNADSIEKPITISQNSQKLGFYIGAAAYDTAAFSNQNFLTTFNSTTPANGLKIPSLLADINKMEYDFTKTDAIIDQALAAGLRVRGHTLVWGKLSDFFKSPNLDNWLAQFPEADRKRQLQNFVQTHITTVLNHYKGKILQWDVVNEPLEFFGSGELENNVFHRQLGKDYIKDAFVLAHQTDPDLKLFLNEQFNHYTGSRSEGFVALVKDLLAQGAPIHGIGIQHHMVFSLESPADTKAYIEQFTALGLAVEITEMDARLRLFKNAQDPYQAQGAYYRDIVKVCLEVKGCNGVTFWGDTDKNVWFDDMKWLFAAPNEPYLFDRDNKAKPGVGLLEELLAKWPHRS